MHERRFAANLRANAGFWRRFGGRPNLIGRTVLDVGCGRGELVVDMATAGAAMVVGVDTDKTRIDFARRHIAVCYPALASRIRFEACELARLDVTPSFDYAVSKNTFEHIKDLSTLLRDIAVRLKPGGQLLTGFGPLYHAPWGDHSRTAMTWLGPWGHLMLPESYIIFRLNRMRRQAALPPIAAIHELGLNQFRVEDYRRSFTSSGLTLVEFTTNAVGRRSLYRRIVGVMAQALAQLPFLAPLFTLNIYAVLEKPLVAASRPSSLPDVST